MENLKETKVNQVKTLIRLAYGYSSFTQLWLQNHKNKDKGTVEFLENDLQSFIKENSSLIDEIIS